MRQTKNMFHFAGVTAAHISCEQLDTFLDNSWLFFQVHCD